MPAEEILSASGCPAPTAVLLTPRGRGAVASIQFAGDCRLLEQLEQPLFRAANGKSLCDQATHRIIFGHWGTEAPEEVVVCRRENGMLEINCHGGEAAAPRILRDLQRVGSIITSWNEWIAASEGQFAAECRHALAHAHTVRTANILLDQSTGTLRSAFEWLTAVPPLYKGGLGGVSFAQFTDDEMKSGVSVDRSIAAAESRALGERPPLAPPSKGGETTALDDLLGWAAFGLHLVDGWRVVLTGRPNVGKSSLMNALLGYARSIVFDEPGTTRDVVTDLTAFQGWPVHLADTAGMRVTAEALESAGIERAREHLQNADCRVIVLDISEPPQTEDFQLLAEWPDALVVVNKSDLPHAWGANLPEGAVAVSALTGHGVETLAAALVKRLIPCVPAPGIPIPFTQRQVELLSAARVARLAGDDAAYRAAVAEVLA